LPRFNSVFERFITTKLKQDTIVLQLDYGNNVFLNKIYCSFEILANQIEKFSDKGIYYFSTFHAQKETISIKTDTIDLHLNKIIEYNGISLKYSDLSNHLKINKPELVILRVDKGVLFQDLADIFEMAKKLKIEIILGEE
jgi:hypothetical protein